MNRFNLKSRSAHLKVQFVGFKSFCQCVFVLSGLQRGRLPLLVSKIHPEVMKHNKSSLQVVTLITDVMMNQYMKRQQQAFIVK